MISHSHIFKKKSLLYDKNPSEKAFFTFLVRYYGHDYVIVPQVGFNHLIEPIPQDIYYDPRSVDFVLYDKENFYPVLAIEVNGHSHHIGHRPEKDVLKATTLNNAGITLLIFDAKSKYTSEDKIQIDAAILFGGKA